DASLAMTFNFTRLPFSVLVGYLMFGELIGWWTWVGAIVIFAAPAFVTHRFAMLARKTISSQELLRRSTPLVAEAELE
ncbi:hypothetical protein J0683_25310, partial [Vibrio parahaemolyticus]|nr:hypothetical protein [Vibrio parahaemolyticus]